MAAASPARARPDAAGAAASESSLLARLRAREREAFALVVRRHGPSMRRLARSLALSDAVADEVVQDAFLTLVDKLGTFEGRSSLRTWLLRVVANAALARREREGRSVPFSSLAPPEAEDEVDPSRFTRAGSWAESPAWARDPESALAAKETVGLLARALETLPENQRAVVVLRDVEGLGAGEACDVLGVSEANQRVLLHRGRTRLRKALEAFRREAT